MTARTRKAWWSSAAAAKTGRADYAINRPTFPYFGIEWVERGQGGLWLRGRRHDLEPGAVFCYGPSIPCRIQTDARQPLIKYFVDITGPDALGLLKQSALAPGNVCDCSGSWNWPSCSRECTVKAPATAPRPRRSWPPISACSCSRSRPAGSPIDHSKVRLPRFAQETFLRCRQFLQDQFRQYPTIEQAAVALELSPSYLCRLFREHGELSPYQYLLRVRMNHALDRLLLSGGRVKQACYESGFTDPAHFCALFKQIHGLPPRRAGRAARSAPPRQNASDRPRVPASARRRHPPISVSRHRDDLECLVAGGEDQNDGDQYVGLQVEDHRMLETAPGRARRFLR